MPVICLFVLRSTCTRNACRAWVLVTDQSTGTVTPLGYARPRLSSWLLFAERNDPSQQQQQSSSAKRQDELQNALQDLFQQQAKRQQQPQQQSPSSFTRKSYTTWDLQEALAQSQPLSSSSLPTFNDPSTDATSDAPYLDTDVYLQSTQYVDETDGTLPASVVFGTDKNGVEEEEEEDEVSRPNSATDDMQVLLQSLLQPPPSVPDDSSHSNDSEDQLWNMLKQRASTMTVVNGTNNSAESLHQQIMAREQAFYNQSTIFLESLSDATKATDAATYRRSQQYQRRIQKALDSLDDQVQQFVNNKLPTTKTKVVIDSSLEPTDSMDQSNNNNQRLSNTHCSLCRCLLTETEMTWFARQSPITSPQRLCQVCHGERLVQQQRQEQKRQERSRPPRSMSADSTKHQARTSRPPPPMERQRKRPQGRAQRDSRRNSVPTPRRSDQSTVTNKMEDVNDSTTDSIDETMATSPWIQIQDPDTGETFYWNEETEEMKWEL